MHVCRKFYYIAIVGKFGALFVQILLRDLNFSKTPLYNNVLFFKLQCTIMPPIIVRGYSETKSTKMSSLVHDLSKYRDLNFSKTPLYNNVIFFKLQCTFMPPIIVRGYSETKSTKMSRTEDIASRDEREAGKKYTCPMASSQITFLIGNNLILNIRQDVVITISGVVFCCCCFLFFSLKRGLLLLFISFFGASYISAIILYGDLAVSKVVWRVYCLLGDFSVFL